jgi:hypothetical protein
LPDDAQEAERQNRNIFSEEKRDNPQPKQATVTKYAIDRTMNNETAKGNRATTHAICKIREARAMIDLYIEIILSRLFKTERNRI